jgi:hypothetical protein
VAFRKRAKLSLKSRQGKQAFGALKAGASEINKKKHERPNEGGGTAGKRGKRTSQDISIFKPCESMVGGTTRYIANYR